jgi:hypothetical protein
MRHQRRARAHAATGHGGFTAGVATAYDCNIESGLHRFCLGRGVVAEGLTPVKNIAFFGMFHVKHRELGI